MTSAVRFDGDDTIEIGTDLEDVDDIHRLISVFGEEVQRAARHASEDVDDATVRLEGTLTVGVRR